VRSAAEFLARFLGALGLALLAMAVVARCWGP
jgi:hypothetical protein